MRDCLFAMIGIAFALAGCGAAINQSPVLRVEIKDFTNERHRYEFTDDVVFIGSGTIIAVDDYFQSRDVVVLIRYKAKLPTGQINEDRIDALIEKGKGEIRTYTSFKYEREGVTSPIYEWTPIGYYELVPATSAGSALARIQAPISASFGDPTPLPAPTSWRIYPGYDGTLTIIMRASEFAFDPDTINGRRGQVIHLTVKNEGSVDHTWVFPASNVKLTISPGASISTKFLLPGVSGTYSFECDIPGHQEAGMMGRFVVE